MPDPPLHPDYELKRCQQHVSTNARAPCNAMQLEECMDEILECVCKGDDGRRGGQGALQERQDRAGAHRRPREEGGTENMTACMRMAKICGTTPGPLEPVWNGSKGACSRMLLHIFRYMIELTEALS